MSNNWVVVLFDTVLGLGLWIIAIVALRFTPLTGGAFLLASFALTLLLAALGWMIMTVWIRLDSRRRT